MLILTLHSHPQGHFSFSSSSSIFILSLHSYFQPSSLFNIIHLHPSSVFSFLIFHAHFPSLDSSISSTPILNSLLHPLFPFLPVSSILIHIFYAWSSSYNLVLLPLSILILHTPLTSSSLMQHSHPPLSLLSLSLSSIPIFNFHLLSSLSSIFILITHPYTPSLRSSSSSTLIRNSLLHPHFSSPSSIPFLIFHSSPHLHPSSSFLIFIFHSYPAFPSSSSSPILICIFYISSSPSLFHPLFSSFILL